MKFCTPARPVASSSPLTHHVHHPQELHKQEREDGTESDDDEPNTEPAMTQRDWSTTVDPETGVVTIEDRISGATTTYDPATAKVPTTDISAPVPPGVRHADPLTGTDPARDDETSVASDAGIQTGDDEGETADIDEPMGLDWSTTPFEWSDEEEVAMSTDVQPVAVEDFDDETPIATSRTTNSPVSRSRSPMRHRGQLSTRSTPPMSPTTSRSGCSTTSSAWTSETARRAQSSGVPLGIFPDAHALFCTHHRNMNQTKGVDRDQW